MNKKEIVRYLQSIIAIPVFAIAMPLSGVSSISSLTVANNSLTDENSVITTQEEVARKEKAESIDNYFAKYNAPLEGYGMKFVLEAEKNGLDWRLLPAIAMREKQLGAQACKSAKAPNNNFGWASCKMGFESIGQSIEHISKTLGGNNDNVKHYKSEMTTEQILKKYNPDSIVPGYSKQVIKIMKAIDSEDPII